MATTDGSASGDLFADKQWMYYVLPIILVAGFAVIGIAAHKVVRRSRRDLRLNKQVPQFGTGSAATAAARATVERDLQEAWVRGAQRQQHRDGRRARARAAEGLNELGEAPPPYGSAGGGWDGGKRNPRDEEEAWTDVELDALRAGQSSRQGPPAYEQAGIGLRPPAAALVAQISRTGHRWA